MEFTEAEKLAWANDVWTDDGGWSDDPCDEFRGGDPRMLDCLNVDADDPLYAEFFKISDAQKKNRDRLFQEMEEYPGSDCDDFFEELLNPKSLPPKLKDILLHGKPFIDPQVMNMVEAAKNRKEQLMAETTDETEALFRDTFAAYSSSEEGEDPEPDQGRIIFINDDSMSEEDPWSDQDYDMEQDIEGLLGDFEWKPELTYMSNPLDLSAYVMIDEDIDVKGLEKTIKIPEVKPTIEDVEFEYSYKNQPGTIEIPSTALKKYIPVYSKPEIVRPELPLPVRHRGETKEEKQARKREVKDYKAEIRALKKKKK